MNKYSLAAFLFFGLLSSCCKKKDDEVRPVSSSLTESVPYVNNQIVKFKNKAGDTLTFTAIRKLFTDDIFRITVIPVVQMMSISTTDYLELY